MSNRHMDEIMEQYVSVHRGDKTHDLKKFYEASASAHGGKKTVFVKAATACMAIVLCCVISLGAVWVHIQSAYSIPRDLKQTVASHYESVNIMASVGATAQSTVEACLASEHEDIMVFLQDVTLPNIYCSEITISKLYDNRELNEFVGISAELQPNDADIEKIELVYFSNDYQVRKLSRYQNVFNNITWDDCAMSYQKIPIKKEYIFRFESPDIYGYMRVRCNSNLDVSELLKEIF